MLDELNDAVEIEFLYNQEIIAERTWNYLPNVGDAVELIIDKKATRFKVYARLFLDRNPGFFAGISSQRVSIQLVQL